MVKLTVVVSAVALAGAAAAGWRDLRVDASSEAAFQQSLDTFIEELSPEREHVFLGALMDIWNRGTLDAKTDQREFTVNDYYRQLDGLSYEEIVTFTDPCGDTARERYREAKRMSAMSSAPPVSPWQQPFHASQEQRTEIAHERLDSGELTTTRNGGETESVPAGEGTRVP